MLVELISHQALHADSLQSYNEIGAGSREGAGDLRGYGAAIMVQFDIRDKKGAPVF